MAESLDAIAAQLPHGLREKVEVVITDNASADHTADVVGRARAAGLPVRYERHERNLGAAANIRRVVEVADAEWCWLLSSDDVLAPGGLAAALAVIERHPGVAGITVGQAVFVRDMSGPAEEQATAITPDLGHETVLRGRAEIVGRLGLIMSGLSSQIVHRDRWLREADTADDAPHYPHVAVMFAMTESHPEWVWVPQKLVWVRAAHGNLRMSLERWNAGLLAELDRHWRGRHGVHAPGRAGILRTYQAYSERRARRARPPELTPSRSDDWLVLRAESRVLWRSPRFWRTTAPRLAARVLTPRNRRPPRGRMAPLAPADRRARLAAALPASLTQAEQRWVRCTLHGTGAETLRSAAPAPVHLAVRWRRRGAADWSLGNRQALPRALRPGRRLDFDVSVVAPWEPGDYELGLELVQEDVAWFGATDTEFCGVANRHCGSLMPGARSQSAAAMIVRRRLHQQRLLGGALATPADAVGFLGAMQAQEFAEAKWSIAQRLAGAWTDAEVEAAFARGEILRTHVLRPTWHFVAADDFRWLLALSGPRVQAGNRSRYRQLGLDEATLARGDEAIAQCLDAGPLTRRQIAAALPGAGIAHDGQRLPYLLCHAELGTLICSLPARREAAHL